MANLWHDIPPGPDVPKTIYVIVEIPKRSRNKFEYDKAGPPASSSWIACSTPRSTIPAIMASSRAPTTMMATRWTCW